jgi:NAD-dependent dihydropyrimidine dehydrogenase PreA subunit
MPESPYRRIAKKWDELPMRCPRKGDDYSPAFLQYLEACFPKEEAEIVAVLEVSPRLKSPAQAAEELGLPPDRVAAVLHRLADAYLINRIGGGYALPLIANMLNTLMLDEGKSDLALLSARLYQEYFIRDGFFKYYEGGIKETPVMRAIAVNETIRARSETINVEIAEDVVDEAPEGSLTLTRCPCRSRTEKLGIRECRDKFPVASCLMMGMSGIYFQGEGRGRKVEPAEAKNYLREMAGLGLVLTTDNFRDPNHLVICACCGCCCSQTRGVTRWNHPVAVNRANFLPRFSEECVGCGTCEKRCVFKAITLVEKKARVDETLCRGCGICVLGCKKGAVKLEAVEPARSHIFPTGRDLFRKIKAENHPAP